MEEDFYKSFWVVSSVCKQIFLRTEETTLIIFKLPKERPVRSPDSSSLISGSKESRASRTFWMSSVMWAIS